MFRYEVRGPAAWLVIDDPDRRNPLSLAVIEMLREGLSSAAADEQVRVVVVTGRRPGVLGGWRSLRGFFDKPIELHHGSRAFAEMLRTMRRLGKPTIARVNGHACWRIRAGGGATSL